MLRFGNCGCYKPDLIRRMRVTWWDSAMVRLGRFPWFCKHCHRQIYRKSRT